jgi:Mn-dependent DtxR family transcriptional regulator
MSFRLYPRSHVLTTAKKCIIKYIYNCRIYDRNVENVYNFVGNAVLIFGLYYLLLYNYGTIDKNIFVCGAYSYNGTECLLNAELNTKSNRLESIRDAHNVKKEDHTDRMEDYLEVIYELVQQKGYATTIDISRYLNVSSPSVTKMLQKLDECRYLDYEKYRGIRLTQEGISIAKNIHERHSLLSEFLKMIGVDEDTANKDAEGIEHHLHPQTLKKLEEFVRHIKKKPEVISPK